MRTQVRRKNFFRPPRQRSATPRAPFGDAGTAPTLCDKLSSAFCAAHYFAESGEYVISLTADGESFELGKFAIQAASKNETQSAVRNVETSDELSTRFASARDVDVPAPVVSTTTRPETARRRAFAEFAATNFVQGDFVEFSAPNASDDATAFDFEIGEQFANAFDVEQSILSIKKNFLLKKKVKNDDF